MRNISVNKKLLLVVVGIAAILLFIFFGPLANFGKIDDWQFTPGQFSPLQIVGQILENAPFSEFWYFYLLALGAIILFLIPVLVFFQGLVMRVKHGDDQFLRARGIHKISLGLPTTIIFISTLIVFIVFCRGFYPQNEKTLFIILGILGGVLAAVVISLIVLFVRGLYLWIKFRADRELRKKGRNKFLFAIYNTIVIFVIFLIPLTLLVSMGGARSSSSYSGYGSAPGTITITNPLPAQSFGFSNLLERGGDTIGFSVGGAKDINNLRENIKNDFLPIPTDVTYEGLFYDYFFDTGVHESCQKLFCPSYTSAISKDPFSGKDDYFLSVGLNSGIQQKDFARKKLNLIIVLDISGSMSSPFDSYYYDKFGARRELFAADNEKDSAKSKMQVAAESAVALLDHLNPDDSFGMVLFDQSSYLAKPLRKIGDTDMEAIKRHILELQPQGSTNMSAGMKKATDQFNDYLGSDSDEFENRIIFLTDAQPNTGDISETGMLGIAKSDADKKIYTTFIGIGVDFNTELIEQITKVRGANYYSVHSPSEFKKRMDDGFDFMVTPLVFNLQLTIDAPGFKIQEVYGSPEANEATGEIMKVNTLFPSEKTEGETRGGLVLLHMKRISDNNAINLTASYEDRNGRQDSNFIALEFEKRPEFYDNTGIHKGIVLARYANLLKNWLLTEREIIDKQKLSEPIVPPVEIYYIEGIPIIDPEFVLGRWERQSVKLHVSDEYKELLAVFIPYFEKETTTIGDESLNRETDILLLLSGYKNP